MPKRKSNCTKYTYGYSTRFIASILVFTIILSSVFTSSFSASAETVDNGVTLKNIETTAPEELYIIGEDIERRSENEKHFLMSDGTRVAAMYDTAVHYLDESGEYQEIDNSFETTANDEYQTKKGKNKVKLAKKASAKKLVTLHTDDYKISWGFEGAEKVKAQVVEDNNETDEEFAVKNINGKMMYVDAFENIDLEYIVRPDEIKENIILKSADAQNEFVINYDVGGLVAVQKDTHTIELLDGEAVKYTISAPVMVDANNKMSADLSITLTEQKNGKLTVVLSANSVWLSDPKRAYPVIVDPGISSSLNFSALQCKFTYTATDAGVSNLANSVTDITFVGYHPQFGDTTSLYYFEALPTLSKGDYVTDARFFLMGSDNPKIQIDAHECAEIWSNGTTIPLNCEPFYDEEVIDYVEYESNDYCWNITNQVRKWYDLGAYHYNNCGIILTSYFATVDYITFANSNNSNVNIRPVLAVSYVNHSGIENYLSYTTLPAGGGTAYINNASGIMTLELPIVSTRGENSPAALAMYYNATQAGIQGVNVCGAGWRTNYDQKITAITNSALISNGYKYIYTDPDGTTHYMKAAEGKTNEYADEIGAGLTLKYENNTFTLSDKENNICYFNALGQLTKQKSGTSPSAITIAYDSANKLSSITDGAGDKISFERNSNGIVTAIIDNYGRKINLTYTNSNLTAITYFDGTVLSFNYNSEGFLTLAVDDIGMRTEFAYSGTACPAWNGRVSFVYEKSKNDSTSGIETGGFLNFSYTHSGYTEICDNNVNKTYYIFDEFGRSINGFSDNQSASAEYTKKDENASYTNNKITKTTSVGAPIENLAKNTSYESSDDWYPYISPTGTASATLTSEEKMLGTKSLKLTAAERADTTYYQSYIPTKSGYYTYSVYYKTDGLEADIGVKIFIAYIDNYENKSYVFSEGKTASTNGEWKRLSVTYYCDVSKIKRLHIANGLFYSYSGSVYFDCAQLEYSNTANEYNMISNGFFNSDTNGWTITEEGYLDKVQEIDTQYYVGNAPQNIEKSYVVSGGAANQKRIGQTVSINLPSNKVALNFSAYAMARACKETGFALELTFNYSDGTKEIETRNFNYKCYAWQYLTELFVPKQKTKTVASVDAYLTYCGQANIAEFTGVQLLVDTTGMMYTYDDKGNALSALDTADNSVSSEYDAENRLKTKTLQDGSVFTYDYLTDSAVSTRLIASQTAPHNQKTDFTYNTYGQQTSNTLYNATEQSGLKITSSAEYSGNGKYLNTETDSLGNTIRYIYSTENGGYDLLDRIYSNSNSNAFTEYAYDTADRIVGLTENDGNQALASVEYVYDNNTLAKITHNGFDYNFEYDDFGNTTEISVGDNNLITNTFSRNYITLDGIQLTSPHVLTKSTYGNGDYIEYDYDRYERVIAKKLNGTVKYKYIYNSAGNIYQLTDAENNVTYTYYYDNLGRVNKIYGSNKFEVSYTYDGSNRVTDEYYAYNEKIESVHHNYDVGGVLTSSTFSDGSVRSYTYDSLMRASSVTTKLSENATESWITSYGFLNPTADTTSTLVNSITYSTINLNLSYSYDNLGNITEIKENNVLKASYEYDGLNQLIRENNAYLNKTVTYSYDNAGNILSKTYYNYTLGSLVGLTGTVVQYTYGDSAWKDKLTAYNGNTITYDEIGNPLTYYNGFTFTWKNGRNLSSVRTSNGRTANYRYNESGIRTYKKADGIETHYYLNGSQISAMKCGNFLYRFSYDSSGQLYSINFNGTKYYYFFNVQGDVIGLYDSDLNVVVRYTYDSWGKALSVTGSLAGTLGQANPFRYRGYYYDTETGLYYLNSRYYDPETGRFINADDIEVLDAETESHLHYNLFSYCWNNPTNMLDDNGDLPWFIASALCGALFDTTAYLIGAAISGKKVTWSGVGKAALGGAVSGVAFGALGKGIKAIKTSVKASKAIKYTTGTANRVGKIGEKISGITKNKTKYFINGRWRIPDGITKKFVQEVKNVKSLSLTSQLKDSIHLAQKMGKRVQLFIRPDTRLSGPLKQAIKRYNISIKHLW